MSAERWVVEILISREDERWEIVGIFPRAGVPLEEAVRFTKRIHPKVTNSFRLREIGSNDTIPVAGLCCDAECRTPFSDTECRTLDDEMTYEKFRQMLNGIV